MGKIYARKIMQTTDGSYTIANVPNLWLAKTSQAFKDFTADGTITEEQYKQYTNLDYEA